MSTDTGEISDADRSEALRRATHRAVNAFAGAASSNDGAGETPQSSSPYRPKA